MKITAKTDIGLVRSTNEDTYTFIKKDDDNFLAFVCDGMGGHLGGSFASAKAVEMINEAFNSFTSKKTTKSIGVWLFDANTKINAYIYEQSINHDN